MTKQINLTREEQIEAFANAAAAVRHDAGAGDVDVRTWGENVTDGEIVRVVCEAYAGVLEVDVDAIDPAAGPIGAGVATDGGADK